MFRLVYLVHQCTLWLSYMCIIAKDIMLKIFNESSAKCVHLIM